MRPIDADKFEEFIREKCSDSLVDLWCELVRRQPTIEAVQVVKAEWIEVYDENYKTWYYDCSKCGDGFATKEKCQSLPNFCSECGADMRKGGAE